MATKTQLKQRWSTGRNKQRSKQISDVLFRAEREESPPTRKELRGLLEGLEYSEEVGDQLDFRGMEFPTVVSGADLSNSRFEYATFRHHIDASLAGSILIGVEAKYRSFFGSVTKADFSKANLTRGTFRTAVKTNFTDAKMHSVDLAKAKCRGAIFRNADMRMAYAPDADLRAADLSGANLTTANLFDVKFDKNTKVAGATMIDTTLHPDLKEFCIANGAIVAEGKGTYDLTIYQGTINYLKREMNNDGHLDAIIARMEQMLPEVQKNPRSFEWVGVIQQEFGPEAWREVEEATEGALSNPEEFGD